MALLVKLGHFRSGSTRAHDRSGRSHGVGRVNPAARREPRGPDHDLTCFSGEERDDEPVRPREPPDAPAAQPGRTTSLKPVTGRSSLRDMKQAWMCGALAACLLTVPELNAQGDATRAAALADRDAAEERYRRLNTAVEGMLGAQAEQQRRLDALAAELARVRTETARAGGDYVTRSELNELVKSIQEIDRKREADRRLILEELETLGKSLADLIKGPARRAEPTPAPKATTTSPSYQEYVEHTLQPRETIWALVTAYNAEYRAQGRRTSEKLVLEANPRIRPEALQVGQKIIIPLVPR
jgi:hypothetical protein